MNSHPNSALEFAEQVDFSAILTNPILDIGARVWEPERYDAFKVFYRSMRAIDDLVDHARERAETGSYDPIALRNELLTWLERIKSARQSEPFLAQFQTLREQFRLPWWPWERLVQSMIYDLDHNGFQSFHLFLRYCEGAAIAPASVFTHLCGVTKISSGYESPTYNIRRAARDLALFSYLVHILRDLFVDQRRNLNYFSDDLLKKSRLTRTTVREIAINASSHSDSDRLRNLVVSYLSMASRYKFRSRITLDQLAATLSPRYQLSLELIYELYSQVFERISQNVQTLDEESWQPKPAEIEERIFQTIARFKT